jgi:hypothetical protein
LIGYYLNFVFFEFWRPFWGPNRPNIGQYGLEKCSKRAKIAKTSGFENMRFDLVFTAFLEYQEGSQDSSREPPRTFQKEK